MTLDPLTRFLVAMLPDRYRDDIAGDLTEEALTVIAPAAGDDAARRWMRMQLIRSLPGTLSLHIRQREDDEMKHFKWVSVAAIASVGIPVFLVLVLVPRFVAQSKRGQDPPSPGASA